MAYHDWRPSVGVDMLRRRARLLRQIRSFFAQRGVLEVETPLLGAASATDLHVASLETCYRTGGPESGERMFLQTSPEFAMKRLLAAGSGPIYQICKAFRDDAPGRLHAPEFTLLEWYRPGFDQHALMDELEELIGFTARVSSAARTTYAEAFRRHADLDPFTASTEELRRRAVELSVASDSASALDRDACLDLVLGAIVQPHLGPGATFVYDFPASQAALALIRPDPIQVAERFELFVDGVELANGYHELTDADELRRRMHADLERREADGLPAIPIDERLLGAMRHGLPDCAGVALGLDRLLMVITGKERLEEVVFV